MHFGPIKMFRCQLKSSLEIVSIFWIVVSWLWMGPLGSFVSQGFLLHLSNRNGKSSDVLRFTAFLSAAYGGTELNTQNRDQLRSGKTTYALFHSVSNLEL